MSDITENLYEERKIMAMGNYYMRHVDRMTREGLRAKSDIAAELGFRDMEIDRLRARVAELESQPADQYTAELVEIDGHTYGLRPGAARVVREAMRDARRAAMLESMLACEREKVANAVRLLTGIHSLLYPTHITAEDGRVWAFRPRSIDPHEVLQELSDRIRELPEKIAAMAKDGAP